jgi:hypothetical protein
MSIAGVMHIRSGRPHPAAYAAKAAPADAPYRSPDHVPAPTLTRGQLVEQLAADPEFLEAFGREGANPWR